MVGRLNGSQRAIYDTLLAALNDPPLPRLYYLDGPGGSGKTFLYTTLFHSLVGMDVKIQCTASTGIAATLPPHGRTAASLFKLNISNDCKTRSHRRGSKDANAVKELDVIVWGEASMVSKKALEAVDTILRDITGSEHPFGGKVIIMGGDFRQVLPVVRNGSRMDQIQASIKLSTLWPLFQHLSLHGNMRVQNDDQQWKDFLHNRITLPSEIQSVTNVVQAVYGSQIEAAADRAELSKRAILAPKNFDISMLNAQVLNLMDGVESVFLSRDKAVHDSNNKYLTTELLNTINTSSLPLHKLALKPGCIVMLLRNLDVVNGLCNGTRMVVETLGSRTLVCRLITITGLGRRVIIPRIDCYEDQALSFKLRRTQFPVKLSFALSINKAQGQSFYRVGLCLPSDVFAHGQIYVALSRVRSKDGLCVMSKQPKLLNVVYREVL